MTVSSLIARISMLATTMGTALKVRGFKTGGTAGQVPIKIDGTDFLWAWGDVAGDHYVDWNDLLNVPNLVLEGDSRLSDSRTPLDHAIASHTDAAMVDLPTINTPLATALAGKLGVDEIPFISGVAQVMRAYIAVAPGGVQCSSNCGIALFLEGEGIDGSPLYLYPPIAEFADAIAVATAVKDAIDGIPSFAALWSTTLDVVDAQGVFIDITRRVPAANDGTFNLMVVSENGITGGGISTVAFGSAKMVSLANSALSADYATNATSAASGFTAFVDAGSGPETAQEKLVGNINGRFFDQYGNASSAISAQSAFSAQFADNDFNGFFHTNNNNTGVSIDADVITAAGFVGPLSGNATSSSGLKTATTTVSVSGATAPTSGQVLTATGTAAATWQTPSGGAAGTLTGATLASNVIASSLTSTGTLTGGATGAGFTVALGTATITGTLPAANSPSLFGDIIKFGGTGGTTLVNIPAISGANLTALNGSSITTGTVSLARLVNTQTVGNADATLSALVRDVILNTVLTLPRVYTLPLASSYPAGARVSFSDILGTLTATNTATLLRAGTDTINSAMSIVLSTANASVMIISDGVSKWNVDIQGVSRGGTGTTNGSITGTGALTFAAGGTNQNINLTPSGTGRVSIANGTAAAPSLTFASQSTAGWYWDNTNRVVFSVGGQERSAQTGNGFIFSSNVATMGIAWGSPSGGWATDTGVYRNAAGVVEVNNGTAGGAGSLNVNGDIKSTVVGKGLQIKGGSALARAGNAQLGASGSVTVANTTVTANTVIILTRKSSGGTIGMAVTYTVTAGTSFSINSDSALDTSTYSFLLIEVNP